MLNIIKCSISYFIILNFCLIIKTNQDFLMIYKEIWQAIPTNAYVPTSKKTFSYVIVHESGGPICNDLVQCSECLQNLQDVKYNFLIGGDGLVYEGRGWYQQGTDFFEYGFSSISIAFIGTFSDNIFLTEKAWATFKKFLKFGVEIKLISKEYQILGHRQFYTTFEQHIVYQASCPGMNVYQLLSSLSQWNNATFMYHSKIRLHQ